jgi:hypothetical protein
VKLGLVVGLIFLSDLSGCEAGAHAAGDGLVRPFECRSPGSGRITDWGIYLGVAVSVVSGLLIAYLRPGAELIPEVRGLTTSSPALNAAIKGHAFVSNALEWLCGFHAAYALWYWLIKERGGEKLQVSGLHGPSVRWSSQPRRLPEGKTNDSRSSQAKAAR